MNYTIYDFYQMFRNKVKLLSGEEGMSREITDVGILDYETAPMLKDKYFHTNFHENLLVITTFSVIKDNPFKISDIVKHLIDKGCSGLIIKNVFHVAIPDSVFRYADYKKFPIFLIADENLFLETIIYKVFRKIETMTDILFIQNELNSLLKQKLSGPDIKDHVKRFFSSCGEQFFIIYVESALLSFEEIESRFVHSVLKNVGNTVLPYKNGFFFVYSDEEISSKFSDVHISTILGFLTDSDENTRIGVSDYHLRLEEFVMALQESLYASTSQRSSLAPFVKYSSLGIKRLIFPFSDSLEFQRYMNGVLKRILDYDIENNAQLLQTIESYINCECNFSATASALNQHRNTIRYRLAKIQELTGLDCKKFSDLEQISIALKIYHHEVVL